MIFHSLAFLLFLGFVLLIVWRLQHRWQNRFLLAASWFFYGCVTWWWLVPFAITMMLDWHCAKKLEDSPPERRKRWLLVSVVFNLSLLGYFKYRGFFLENVQALWAFMGWGETPGAMQFIVPAGISFYTFQSMSYVVDVWRRQMPACRSLRDYMLFVSFFPQLVAGPIERASHLLDQVQTPRTAPWEKATGAITLMLWGYVLKLVISDNAALFANKGFSLQSPSFPILWAGVLAFAVQIYGDFAAYTAIARGVARLLGFELMENFRHPYLAVSPADFWKRWHISLSTWMRDYVYIPLGGNRGGKARAARNVILTFVISGAWHGAAWNYLLWGLYWGLLVAADNLWGAKLRLPAWVRVPVMWGIVGLGWMFFREQDFAFLRSHLTLSPSAAPAADWQLGIWISVQLVILSVPFWLHAFWDHRLRAGWERYAARTGRGWLGEMALGSALFLLILILRSPESSAFIYFQF